jgi:hypothetical protein
MVLLDAIGRRWSLRVSHRRSARSPSFLKVRRGLPFSPDMALGSVTTAASAGLASATDRLEKVAVATASGSGDLAAGAADLSAARVQMSASVAVMRASNEMLGTLLDIMA